MLLKTMDGVNGKLALMPLQLARLASDKTINTKVNRLPDIFSCAGTIVDTLG